MLYLETPTGVGFSYSNDTSYYLGANDAKTTEDNLLFLHGSFDKFPEYKTRDLYLTGESYAGHYMPQWAELIVEWVSSTFFSFLLFSRIWPVLRNLQRPLGSELPLPQDRTAACIVCREISTLLEGIALSSNRNFRVLSSSYPWIARIVLSDSSPRLIGNRPSHSFDLFEDAINWIHAIQTTITETFTLKSHSSQILDGIPERATRTYSHNQGIKAFCDEIADGIAARDRFSFNLEDLIIQS